MSKKTRSKEWDPHKDEILRLYMVEKLTVDQVMIRLKEKHGFDQKKPHYEYRLKLWGARKNFSKPALDFISHQQDKRAPSQDLGSGAWIVNGIPVPESRLKRAKQRNNFHMSLAAKYGKASIPKLPPGHDIRRASPPGTEIAVIWPKSLPWILFEQGFNKVIPHSLSFTQILARALKSCGLMSSMFIGDSSDLASTIFAASHKGQPNTSNLARARVLPCIPDIPQSSMIYNGLKTPIDVATKLLKAFLFQVSNKLGEEGINHYPWKKDLISLIQDLDGTNPMILSHLIDSHDHTSEAILESLYEAAIEHGAIALVYRLLTAGRDANALLSIGRETHRSLVRGKAFFSFDESLFTMTALQYAAATCNIHLANILIEAGAKADLGDPTPLLIVCGFSEADNPDSVFFAQLLVSKGAEVNTLSDYWVSPLEGAVACSNRSLVCYLLQCGATDVLSWPDRQNYNLNYKFLDSEGCEFLLPGHDSTRVPTSALQLAIVAEDDSITESLMFSILSQKDRDSELLEKAFITACVAGDQVHAQEILRYLDAPLEENEDLIDSAFFATGWDMDCRVAQLLVRHRAVRRKLQKSSLSIFQAAALHGNISLILLLLRNGFDINRGPSLKFKLQQRKNGKVQSPPSKSSNPLACAVWMGHEHIIKTLLSLGADTTGIDLITAIQTRSLELVTQALNRFDNVNMTRDGQSALDFAIRGRIGLTVIHKMVGLGAVLQGHELVDAVRSNDQGVVSFFWSTRDLIATNPRGENVLEAACCTGNLQMASLYFAYRGWYGSRALLLAVSRAARMHSSPSIFCNDIDYRIVECIVAHRRSGPIDEYEASALALSIRMDNTRLADMLLDDVFQPSTASSTYCGDHSAFLQNPKHAVEAGVSPLDYENPGLTIQEIVQQPYRYNHPHKSHFFSPLLVAAVMAQERIATKMLEHGYLLDPYLFDMLHKPSCTSQQLRNTIMSAYVSGIKYVVEQDWHQDMLLVALERGVDLGIIQQHFTKLPSLDFERRLGDPLSNAVLSGSCDHVRAVLQAGATADARRWRPAAKALHVAIEMGSQEIVSLLLDHDANVNHDPHQAFTAARDLKDLRMTVFLLDHGLDINAPPTEQSSGRTCLESAAEQGRIDAVEMLLSRGLNIQGRARVHLVRSVQFALWNCNYSMADLLKERSGWSDEDDKLAKIDRGFNPDHTCKRFLYNDPTLEGCDDCRSDADTSATSDLDSPPAGDAPMLDIESSFNYHEQTFEIPELSVTLYG